MNIESWCRDILDRRSAKMPGKVQVEGLYEAHLGPMCAFGRVVVEAEPSSAFALECAPGIVGSENETYMRSAVLGVLDMLLTADPYPLRDVLLRVVEVSSHPVDSSSIAFRRAGRDAGRKLLNEARLSGTFQRL
jgi:hypothetical protein